RLAGRTGRVVDGIRGSGGRRAAERRPPPVRPARAPPRAGERGADRGPLRRRRARRAAQCGPHRPRKRRRDRDAPDGAIRGRPGDRRSRIRGGRQPRARTSRRTLALRRARDAGPRLGSWLGAQRTRRGAGRQAARADRGGPRHRAGDGEWCTVAGAGGIDPAHRERTGHRVDDLACHAVVRALHGRTRQRPGTGRGPGQRHHRGSGHTVPDQRQGHRRSAGARAGFEGVGPDPRDGIRVLEGLGCRVVFVVVIRRGGLHRERERGCRRLALDAGVAAGGGRVDRRHDHALMPLDFLLDRMGELPAFDASAAVLVAALARRFPQRVLTVVAPTPADAERWLADLETLAPGAVALYPQRESLGGEEQHVEIAGERIETVAALLEGRIRILITTARATVERTGVPGALADARLTLSAGRGPTLGDVAERLVGMGYTKVPTVTEVGQFSVRGGILDVYGFGMAAPGRVEWWGDDVATLRAFDLDTQRSGDAVERITILPLK